MNGKTFWVAIVGMIVSFFAGFYLANSLNGAEMARLTAESEQNRKSTQQPGSTQDPNTTLSDEEIRQRISEADANPDDTEFQKKLGIALLNYAFSKQDLRLIGESARLLKRAHDKTPKDFEVAIALGTAHYDLGSLKDDKNEWRLAQEFLAKAVEIKPDNVAARADYGSTFAFAEPQDLNRAASEIRKALESEPRNQRALLLLTQVLVMQNSPEAETVYKRLKEVDPNAPAIETLKRDAR